MPDGRSGVTIRMTQADLAQLAGTSRESVSRFLATLERAGVVRVGRGRVTVVEPGRLRAYIFRCGGLQARSSSPPSAPRWSSRSCGGAEFATSGCWMRWRRSRASSKSRSATGAAPMRTRRCRSATARRSLSPGSWPPSARRWRWRARSGCSRVGTGSGYSAAVLARLAGEVITVERVEQLASAARPAAGTERRRQRRSRGRGRKRGPCGPGALRCDRRSRYRALAASDADRAAGTRRSPGDPDRHGWGRHADGVPPGRG